MVLFVGFFICIESLVLCVLVLLFMIFGWFGCFCFVLNICLIIVLLFVRFVVVIFSECFFGKSLEDDVWYGSVMFLLFKEVFVFLILFYLLYIFVCRMRFFLYVCFLVIFGLMWGFELFICIIKFIFFLLLFVWIWWVFLESFDVFYFSNCDVNSLLGRLNWNC